MRRAGSARKTKGLRFRTFVLAELDYLLSRHVGGVAQTAVLDEVARGAYVEGMVSSLAISEPSRTAA